jgi:hypothetical protein
MPSAVLRVAIAALTGLGAAAAGVAAAFASPDPPREPPSPPAVVSTPAPDLRYAAPNNLHVAVRRAAGAIAIDGDLSDPGWQGAATIEKFYDIQPGDNVPPPVKTTAYVTYDDRYFYVAFRCEDPDPSKIRAQYVERDRVRSDQDFVGIMLDTRNDGRSGIELFVNPYGIEDDFARDESNVNGNQEDPAPDFFWDAAAKITPTGWQAEMRIPFSTLRYSNTDPQTWGIVFFRSLPRQFRYQIASNPGPRDSSCFMCHEIKLDGLEGLPHGAHLIAAPYATFTEKGVPRNGQPGGSFVNKPIRADAGGDVKFIPSENTAFDATINPDFSQIESDVAQIAADARFALFYPEKRPFFMEQSQLFNTPIQAVYTRTITSPRWGLRATGDLGGGNAYTALVGQDRGGGEVILPGPTGSSTASQDFGSFFGIGRIQHAFPDRSYVSLLATDRENGGGSGGGHNRVVGPDFQWTPNGQDQVLGQLLVSDTQVPDRPDLAPEWTGRSFSSRAMYATWNHSSTNWFWFLLYKDIGDGFRADDGFVPQVGYREGSALLNYILYPKGFFSRVVPLVFMDYFWDASGRPVTEVIQPGVAVQGRWGLNGEIDYFARDRERSGSKLLPYERLRLTFSFTPPGPISHVTFDSHFGKSIDFIDSRSGDGGDFTLSFSARPSRHLQFDANLSGQWLTLDGRELFKAQAERLKVTYVFDHTTFVRLIGQYVRTDYDTARYVTKLPSTQGGLDASGLLGYQLNWQSVMYLGYGDSRALDENATLQRSSRQVFLKVSYAFQR